MVDKFNDIKRRLKSGVRSRHEAKKLAAEASALLNPEASEARRSLDDAFGQIPIAEQFRGESAAARQSAIEALEELGGKSKKAGKSAKSRKRQATRGSGPLG